MNPNIAMGFQRPRFDPQEGQRNALAMRQAQMQEATTMMQMDQARRTAERDTATRNALANVNISTPEGLRQAQGVYAKAGDWGTASQIEQTAMARAKEARDSQAATQKLFLDAAPLLVNRDTFDAGLAMLPPEAQSKIGNQWSPQLADHFKTLAIGIKGQMEQQNADRTFGETARHNKATEATAAQRAANSGPLALISNTDGSMTAIGGPNGIAPNAMQSIARAKGTIKQAEAEAKAVGDYSGKKYAEILASSDSALMDNSKLDRLDSLLTNIETGKFKGTTNEIKKAGKAMGIDLESMGIRDDVAPVEAARSLAGELTLSAVSAAKLTPVSNTDLQYMNSLQPGIETTPDGRKLVIQSRKAINNRNIEVGKMATKYRKQYGALDEGFQEMVTNFAEQNPLFRAVTTDADYSAIPSGEYFMAPDGSVRKKP